MKKETWQKCFYWTGLIGLFYFLNRKAKRVLVFHNVIERALLNSAVLDGGCNFADEFACAIDELLKRWDFSLDFFDPKTLTITFDDGYYNQYSTAFRILNARDVAAYLFYSGDVGNGLVIDKITVWCTEVPIEYIPGHDRSAFWSKNIWPRYMKDGANGGVNVFRWLDSIYSFDKIVKNLLPEYVHERLKGICHSDLDKMRAAGWIIGWHTKSHVPLAALSDKDSATELTPPEEMRGLPLAYPYGCDDQVSNRECDFARKLGFSVALANTNSSIRNCSRFFFPRMHLWSLNKWDMHYELSGMRHFIQHHRLLPKVRI